MVGANVSPWTTGMRILYTQVRVKRKISFTTTIDFMSSFLTSHSSEHETLSTLPYT